MAGFPDYVNYDGLGLAQLVRRGQVHPRELVEEAIARLERLNPQLNAMIHPLYDRALAAAGAPETLPDGPFRGVPFLLKDILAADQGVPMRLGSRFTAGWVPHWDSELIRRYKAAGLVILGRTSTPEFGLTPTTEPAAFGPCRNPWDLSRTPGGSSGGAAAAVAARIVPLAHGSDGGGSIRIPASCCGLFGLKPTRGRNPLGPDVGEGWHGMVCPHALTRSVRDSAALLDATAGPDTGAPYFAPPPARPFLSEVGVAPGRLRIAFTAQPFLGKSVDEECQRGLEETVALCRELGHELVEAAPPIDGQAVKAAFLTLVAVETRAGIEQIGALLGRRAAARYFEPSTWALALLGRATTADRYAQAVGYLQLTARQIAAFFEEYDLLLTPTLAAPPPLIGALQPQGLERLGLVALGRLRAGRLIQAATAVRDWAGPVFDFIPYTPLFNVTGQPAMSVPLCWTGDGLPVGMHFVGRYGDEATLFRLAAQLERARPWFDCAPAMDWQHAPDGHA